MLTDRAEPYKAGFEAWIEKEDGRRFREYKQDVELDEDDMPYRNTCYVEARHGQTFTVCIRLTNHLAREHWRYDWSMHCTVDGLDIGAETITLQNRIARFSSMHLRKEGQDYAADLVFGFLETTDDDTKVTLKGQDLDRVGKIVISLERGFTGREYEAPARILEDVNVGVAHEKTKKLGTSVVPGNIRPVPRATTNMEWESAEAEGEYWHEFIFYHRTEFQLEKEGIIPRRPSRSNGRLGVDRPRRGTVSYHSRQAAVDDSSDEQEDNDESEYETDTETEDVKVQQDIKPHPSSVAGGPGPSVRLDILLESESKRKRPMTRSRPQITTGEEEIVDLTGLDSDSEDEDDRDNPHSYGKKTRAGPSGT